MWYVPSQMKMNQSLGLQCHDMECDTSPREDKYALRFRSDQNQTANTSLRHPSHCHRAGTLALATEGRHFTSSESPGTSEETWNSPKKPQQCQLRLQGKRNSPNHSVQSFSRAGEQCPGATLHSSSNLLTAITCHASLLFMVAAF